MRQYAELIRKIREEGTYRGDRTGTGTQSIFGHQMRFNLDRFPLVTGKKTFMKSITHELIMFVRGITNIKYLNDNDVHIWDEWAQNVGNYPNPERLSGWVRVIDEDIYCPYDGDYGTSGINAARGSENDNLRNLWVKMMKRCYNPSNHNYSYYGGSGVFVCRRWHDVNTFISDVKDIQNWDLKQSNWKEYELDKDYYGASYYSPETCAWLHTAENNLYTSDPIQVELNGKLDIFMSLQELSDSYGIPTTTLSLWLRTGVPKIPKGVNRKFAGIKMHRLIKEGYVYRLLFTNGDLGPVYGHQWRSWPYNEIMNEGHPEFEGVAKRTIDQLQNVIDQIKTNPLSRRLIVSAWNPAEVDDMALPPCHTMFQFYCTEIDYEERYDMARKMMLPCTTDEDMDNERIPKYKLSCQLYQRSADVFLGVPFNIASYAMLTMMIAKISNMVPGDFIWTGGDCHLYANHTKQVDEYLAAPQYELPVMHIKGRQKTIDDFNFEDFVLEDYVCGKHIKAPIAV